MRERVLVEVQIVEAVRPFGGRRAIEAQEIAQRLRGALDLEGAMGRRVRTGETRGRKGGRRQTRMK